MGEMIRLTTVNCFAC